MRAFEHIHQILVDAGLPSSALLDPADDRLAARAQSAELLGQPAPRPESPAEAQATALHTADCVAERGGDPAFRDAGLPDAAELDALTAACGGAESAPAPRRTPIPTHAVLGAHASASWQTDSLTARLTDSQMAGLDLDDRMALVHHIAHGLRVGGEDEQTIIRLLATAPDPAAVLVALRGEQSALFRRLDRVIDGDAHAEYRAVIRAAWFAALGPSEAAAAMQRPVAALPWADPGLIGALTGDGRVHYERVEIGDDGLIHIEARIMRGPVTIPLAWPALDPLAMVAVRFFADEADFEAGAGELRYMPAVEFLGLYHKQAGQTRRELLDLGLLGLGGMGMVGAGSRLAKLLAAVESAIGAADMVIREHRAAIGAAEGGPAFLDAWDRVMTLAAVYGIAQVARELPDLVRGARSAWQRASGGADGLDAAGRAAVEARLTELEAQVRQAQRVGALRRANASPGAIEETGEQLDAIGDHVRQPHFADRGTRLVPDTGRLPGGIAVPGLKRTITLEVGAGAAQIRGVEVFDAVGESLGRVTSKTEGGVETFDIPFEPSMRVRIDFEDGESLEWLSSSAPPAGTRIRLPVNKSLRNRGLSGGHTRDAWDRTRHIYDDMIRETETRTLDLVLPGGRSFQVTQVRYEMRGSTGWQSIRNPKTLFEGPGDAQLSAFEEHMAPYLAEKMEALPPTATQIDVDVPVLSRSGEPVDVQVRVARDAETGRLTSWWLTEKNFTDETLDAVSGGIR